VIRSGGVEHTLAGRAALPAGAWSHVAVTISSAGTGRLFVNGALQEEKVLNIAPDDLNPPNVNTAAPHHYLGRGVDDSQPLFEGSLDSVRVYSRALSEADVAALGPANQAPALAAISNQTIPAGVPLMITNSATDSSLPWQALAFSLDAAPEGAAIDASTGVLTWRPPMSSSETTNSVTVRVTDNGTPALSATRSFTVTVPAVAMPEIAGLTVTNGQFALLVEGDFGPDYSVQHSTNLVDWSTVFTTNSPSVPFLWIDTNQTQLSWSFYRLLLGPSLP
jgi:hypothetical protein